MIIQIQKYYEIGNISGAIASVINFEVTEAMTLKEVRVTGGANVSGADAEFELKKNGTAISGGDVTIAVGTKKGEATGLNIALAEDDELDLALISGALNAPILLTLTIDVAVDADGITAGSTNKFVTAAEKTKLAALSGTNTGDQNLSSYFDKTVDDSDDITEGSSKKFVTTAEKTKLAALSGTNSGDQDLSGLVAKSLLDSKGDLIVATADNTPARQPVGSNGQVLTADSAEATGVKWATPSGGGGSSNGFSYFCPDAPYLAPSAFDDEFSGASLDAKWSTIGTPTIEYNTPSSHLRMQAGDTGFNGICQTIVSGAAHKFRIKTYAPERIGDHFGLYVGIGTTEFYGLTLYKFGSSPNPSCGLAIGCHFPRSGGFSLFSSQYLELANHIYGYQGAWWLEVEITSGDMICRFSRDGINFVQMFQTGNNWGFTRICIGGDNNNAAGKRLVDWFRKVDSSGYTGKLITI